MTNPLDPAVEAQVDEILKSLVPDQIVSIGRPDGTAEHINQGERKRAAVKTAITRLLLRERVEELERLDTRRHYGKDYQESLDELDEYKAARIATLEAQIKELG